MRRASASTHFVSASYTYWTSRRRRLAAGCHPFAGLPGERTTTTGDTTMSAVTAPIKRSTLVNGIDSAALAGIIDAVKANAEIAKFNFRLTNKWLVGVKTRSIVKEFTGALQTHRADAKGFVLDSGEPPVLLGEDTAPNPGEWLLHSLVSCLTTTIAYHAAARGITIAAIESEIEGDIDLRGFLGLAAEVRKGYSAV